MDEIAPKGSLDARLPRAKLGDFYSRRRRRSFTHGKVLQTGMLMRHFILFYKFIAYGSSKSRFSPLHISPPAPRPLPVEQMIRVERDLKSTMRDQSESDRYRRSRDDLRVPSLSKRDSDVDVQDIEKR